MLQLTLLLACRPSFDTVDEACHSAVKGAENGGALANAVQQRVDCHRRIAGLDRVRLDPVVSTTAASHAAYMIVNDEPTGTEDPEGSGFTGATVADRLEYFGYEDANAAELGIWEISGYRGDLPVVKLVDQGLVAGLFLREPLMISTVHSAGYGDSQGWLDYVLLFDVPADAHMGRPVVYPADGQQEVPTSFYALEPVDPSGDDWLSTAELRGYPITLTFGSSQANGSWNTATNVYDVQVTELDLEGPEGSVAADFLLPGDGRSWLNFTVGVVPKEPLDPSTTYTLTASGTRGDDPWEVQTTFHTRLEDTPANADLLDLVGIETAPVRLELELGLAGS